MCFPGTPVETHDPDQTGNEVRNKLKVQKENQQEWHVIVSSEIESPGLFT